MALQQACLDVFELLLDHAPTVEAVLVAKTTRAIESGELSLQCRMLRMLSTSTETEIISLIELGVSTPTNLPILRHWIDFVLLAADRFDRQSLETMAGCLDHRLRRLVMELREAYKTETSTRITVEPAMLLEGLEKLVVVLLAQPAKLEEKEGSSILGLMSNVFTVEGPVQSVS